MAIVSPATCWAQPQGLTCAQCHPTPTAELTASVHAKLDCRQCHHGAETYPVPAPQAQEYLNRTPGGSPPFDHGQPFAGKPARRSVPEFCGNCHADAEFMNPYGLRIDQLARYRTSGHGKTLAKGDERVAVCTDCHGAHKILSGHDPASHTFPLNVPDTCAACHANKALMAEFDLPAEVVDEYRQSVHGQLLLVRQDTGAPTCATCHGNHSAMPPGFASVGAVCGQCHQHAAAAFATSIHATQADFRGCVQCHGGGEDRHFHHIDKITQSPGVLIERYNHLLTTEPTPSAERITESINPNPKDIMNRALSTCLDCHDELEEDKSLLKLFELLDRIADAQTTYVRTARRLDVVGKGVLLVESQRFQFEDAKTHLIELAPLQHALKNDVVAEKVIELDQVCANVNKDLDDLEAGLRYRRMALVPIWGFALIFSTALYLKFRQLKNAYVKPLPPDAARH